jgi:CheY-like chemotaxis protein
MSRVLVIDDDPSVTRLLEEHLTNEGHEVTAVHLAEEGFLQATTSPPELIFLDVMLPDATGFQMVGRFRENPITQTIPIIMITGSARFPNQQQIGKSMGADDYILKPFNVLDLGDRVRRLIEIHNLKHHPGEEPSNVSIPDPIIKEPELEQDQGPAIESAPVPEPTSVPDWLPPEPVRMAPESTHVLDPIAELEKEPSGLFFVTFMFVAHVFLVGAKERFDTVQAVTMIASGWALSLGLLTGVSALFRIQIDSRKALRVLGWSSTPIVARAAANLFGIIPNPVAFPGTLFWLRPLDLFELAAGIIFCISYRRLPGTSLTKRLFALSVIAVGWLFCARGYLRPF